MMTGKQQNALRDRNLDLFRRVAPEIHHGVADARPAGNGDVGPAFNARFTLRPAEPHQLDFPVYEFLRDILGHARAEGIAFFDEPRTEDAYFLIIIGAADTERVLAAMTRTRAVVVFIVEPDADSLARSLDRVDWTRVLGRAQENGGEAHFIIDGDADGVSASLWRVMRRTDPVAADGFTVAAHGHSDFAKAVIGNLSREAQLIVANLGFFHDELLMIANTYQNLTASGGRLFRPAPEAEIGIPAFVVGSGPSLDWSMEHIRRLQGRAVIISAGSALRPLIKNGIQPDFQIEIENIEVSPLIHQVTGEHDLTGVTLVAAASLEPAAIRGFGGTIYFFRKPLSPYPLFIDDQDRSLPHPGPTVVNAALSFAQGTGFRDIYLFGSDFGSQWPDHHHAKDAYHYSDQSTHEHLGYDIAVEGNFGGTCFTDRGLFSARESAIEAIRLFADGRRYFNCSDGVALAGAEPTMPDTVDPTQPVQGKRQAVADIAGRFDAVDQPAVTRAWKGAGMAAASEAFVDAFSRTFEAIEDFTDPGHRHGLMALLRPAMGYVETPERGAADAATILFRGTLFGMLIMFEYYRTRVADPARVQRFTAIAGDALTGRLRVMGRLAQDALRGAQPLPPPNPEVYSPDATARLPKPPAIGRNAECPCGSGRKFKHCHGKAS